MKQLLQGTRVVLVVLFIAAGANHFLMTPLYLNIMPPYLPNPLALVYLSGVAEIGLGIGLLVSRWSVVAAWGMVALLIAVFPANVHMALHPGIFPGLAPWALWLRLPLQLVLVGWVLLYTRR